MKRTLDALADEFKANRERANVENAERLCQETILPHLVNVDNWTIVGPTQLSCKALAYDKCFEDHDIHVKAVEKARTQLERVGFRLTVMLANVYYFHIRTYTPLNDISFDVDEELHRRMPSLRTICGLVMHRPESKSRVITIRQEADRLVDFLSRIDNWYAGKEQSMAFAWSGFVMGMEESVRVRDEVKRVAAETLETEKHTVTFSAPDEGPLDGSVVCATLVAKRDRGY